MVINGAEFTGGVVESVLAEQDTNVWVFNRSPERIGNADKC